MLSTREIVLCLKDKLLRGNSRFKKDLLNLRTEETINLKSLDGRRVLLKMELVPMESGGESESLLAEQKYEFVERLVGYDIFIERGTFQTQNTEIK